MRCTKEALESLIKDQYGSIPKFAKAIGLSEQTVYTCIKGNLINSYMTTAMPIITALNLDPFQLMEGRIRPLSDFESGFVKVPLYDSLYSDTPIKPETADSFTAIPIAKYKQFPNAFLLQVADNAANRAFPAGSLTLVNPEHTIEHPGHLYAICLDERAAVIRRAFPLGNGLELLPHSTDITLRPFLYDFSSHDSPSIRIVGRAVWCMLPLDWSFDCSC